MTSLTFTAWIVVLFLMVTPSNQSKKILRSYVIRKDRIMPNFQLADLSFFDSVDKSRLYTIETYKSDIHAVQLLAQPSKTPVGALEGIWKTQILNATFSFLDARSNQWKDGTIVRNVHLFANKYTISVNGKQILMKSKVLSTNPIELRDKKGKDLLAQFQSRTGQFNSLALRYDLKVFSNKVPDVVYFFALSIMDHQSMLNFEKFSN